MTPEIVEMNTAEGREMLSGQVQDHLGLGLDEFLERLDRGEYDDTEDDAVLRLVMLAPFAR
ncbi:hypothetical protein GXB85_04770 [Cellulomonas sp. APG4]|nr:hypothetical protein [Cellulomonas sp. APG4]